MDKKKQAESGLNISQQSLLHVDLHKVELMNASVIFKKSVFLVFTDDTTLMGPDAQELDDMILSSQKPSRFQMRKH